MNESLTQSALASAMGEIAQLGKELETALAQIERLKHERDTFEWAVNAKDKQLTEFLGHEERLRASLAKAEAACAEVSFLLRQVVYARSSIGTKFIDEFEAWKLDGLEQRIVVALSTDCGSALLKELEDYRCAERELARYVEHKDISSAPVLNSVVERMNELRDYREREKRLTAFIDQKIAEAKEACKKATPPFDFERGSDLTAYTAVKNFLKSEGLVCSTDWQLGGIAMLRSMKATLKLLREGRWTLEQAEQWVEEQLK